MKKSILSALILGILSIPAFAQSGNVGIGTNAPTNALHVNATADPLRVQGLQTTSNVSDKSLVADANGVVKLSTISPPGILSVQLTNLDTLTRGSNGTRSFYTKDTLVVNTILGASYNAATDSVTVPSGTYVISIAIDAAIISSAVSNPIHSYYYDFFRGDGAQIRIHGNTPSNPGLVSNHGINIIYTAHYTATRKLAFYAGWGAGGNMVAGNQIVFQRGTCINFIRIGD